MFGALALEDMIGSSIDVELFRDQGATPPVPA